MRKTVLLTFILLVFAAWAVAQQGTNSQAPSASSPTQQASPQTPSTSSPTQEPSPQAPTSSPSQQASPQAPSASSPTQESSPQAPTSNPAQQAGSQTPSAGSSLEGCLGGSAGNYTVTDASGKSYKLELPEGAKTSVLDQHIGQKVHVTGTITNTSASGSTASSNAGASGGSASAGSKSQASIRPTAMEKIADTCGSNAGAPPSNK